MRIKSEALDPSRLSAASKRFAARLFQRLPSLEPYARMVAQEGSDEFDLLIDVPSPTGDKDLQIGLWMEKSTDPSVEFGHWHAHAGRADASDVTVEGEDRIIGLIQGIMAGRHVLLSDVGGRFDGVSDLIDLREPDVLLDEMTRQGASDRMRVRTWSGSGDREVTLRDLQTD